MNVDHPFRICWRQQDATAIFTTEALEGDDAIFLATHTPITGFDLAGTHAADFSGADEVAVLVALSDPDRIHAFCVVQGEPGSGKSHLIRWLSVNWPADRDVKLLLRRADGSLEGALRQLQDRLPAEFHELFEGLGVRQKASQQGKANIFLSNLAVMSDPHHFEVPLGDEQWCDRFRPGDILRHPHVMERWKSPSEVIRLLDGAGGERNSASASFDIFDIADLGDLTRPIRHALPSIGAKELAKRIEQEADAVAEYREAGWQAADLLAEHGQEFTYLAKLAAVLNKRRNDAIQNVLGVSAAALKNLFRRIRQELRGRGQRLVLLLEDITSWEGLDDSLIDVLVNNAAASGGDGEADVCPLISVVGLTPAYHEQLQGNYRQRITHEVRLGKSTGGLQDVASLRDPAERVAFVSRYLAAVRAGVPALRAWREDMRSAPALLPPNVCPSCPKRASCHAVFGADGEIGLFPFTGRALDRFFNALKVDDNGQTWRTPRGILQAVLNPCLSQPGLLESGEFPGQYVESSAIERSRLPTNAVSGRLDAMVQARVPGEDQARFRRAVTFWGDPEGADTVVDAGQTMFAGMTRPLFEAFELPWIGSEVAADQSAQPVTEGADPVVSDATGEGTATGLGVTASGAASPVDAEMGDPSEEIGASTGSTIGRAIRKKADPEAKVSAPARNRRTQSQREVLRERLRSWAAGGAIENPSQWNEILYDLIMALDPRLMGVSPLLLQRLVTAEMVKLQGSTAAVRQYLVVPPEDWVRAGLEGVIELELRKDMSPGDRAFHHRNVASMMRRLESLVSAYLLRRLPKSAEGTLWSPVPALTQVLQARAWLRGTVAPDAPVRDQIRVVLSDEDEAQSDPTARSAPWQEWLNSSKGWHDRMRQDLRALVSLAVDGGAAGAPLVDASEMAGAVDRMRRTANMDAVPSEGGGLPDGCARARELAEGWGAAKSRILTTEFQQVRNRTQTLAGLLRGRTVAAHVTRLHAAVSGTSALLHNASADLVAVWQRDFQRIGSRVSEDGTAVEDLIVAIDGGMDIPTAAPLRLKWLSDVPARSLEDALGLAQAGERAIVDLHLHARDCVQDAGHGPSLESIKEVGRELQRASEAGEDRKQPAE